MIFISRVYICGLSVPFNSSYISRLGTRSRKSTVQSLGAKFKSTKEQQTSLHFTYYDVCLLHPSYLQGPMTTINLRISFL